MSYIQLNHVMKKFGDVIAIEDLNLSIEKGECFSMLGPSGCGKTTTLRMIAGFEDLDGGEIKVGDKLLSSKKNNFYLPPEKRNFGLCLSIHYRQCRLQTHVRIPPRCNSNFLW